MPSGTNLKLQVAGENKQHGNQYPDPKYLGDTFQSHCNEEN
jgi:hypothetical protein